MATLRDNIDKFFNEKKSFKFREGHFEPELTPGSLDHKFYSNPETPAYYRAYADIPLELPDHTIPISEREIMINNKIERVMNGIDNPNNPAIYREIAGRKLSNSLTEEDRIAYKKSIKESKASRSNTSTSATVNGNDALKKTPKKWSPKVKAGIGIGLMAASTLSNFIPGADNEVTGTAGTIANVLDETAKWAGYAAGGSAIAAMVPTPASVPLYATAGISGAISAGASVGANLVRSFFGDKKKVEVEGSGKPSDLGIPKNDSANKIIDATTEYENTLRDIDNGMMALYKNYEAAKAGIMRPDDPRSIGIKDIQNAEIVASNAANRAFVMATANILGAAFGNANAGQLLASNQDQFQKFASTVDTIRGIKDGFSSDDKHRRMNAVMEYKNLKGTWQGSMDMFNKLNETVDALYSMQFKVLEKNDPIRIAMAESKLAKSQGGSGSKLNDKLAEKQYEWEMKMKQDYLRAITEAETNIKLDESARKVAIANIKRNYGMGQQSSTGDTPTYEEVMN